MKGKIYLFLKFGNKQNMEDLLYNGTIYLNTIEYFKNLEEQGLRGDDYEGVSFIRNYHEYKILKCEMRFENGNALPINPIEFSVRESNNIQGNIYSLYAIKTPDILEPNYIIDSKVQDFGSHCVVIRDTVRFIERIKTQIKQLGLDSFFGVVNYYDKKKANGDISIFNKPKEFDFQKEFRIVVPNDENRPLVLKIGNMSEYAEIHKSNIIHEIKINHN